MKNFFMLTICLSIASICSAKDENKKLCTDREDSPSCYFLDQNLSKEWVPEGKNLPTPRIAFDFDKDGCLASAPVYSKPTDNKNPTSNIGKFYFAKNPGIPKGSVLKPDEKGKNCHYEDQLERANILYREICTERNEDKYCATVYALYATKDQGAGGHSHDWEHAVLWKKNDVVEFVGTSAHGHLNNQLAEKSAYNKKLNSFDVVYHAEKNRTHALRKAKCILQNGYCETSEIAENPTGIFVLPNPLDLNKVSNEYSSVLTDKWGNAKLEIRTVESTKNWLNSKIPKEGGNKSWKKQNIKF